MDVITEFNLLLLRRSPTISSFAPLPEDDQKALFSQSYPTNLESITVASINPIIMCENTQRGLLNVHVSE